MDSVAENVIWRRRCWLTAAVLVLLGSIVRAALTQTADRALLVFLVWGGALCCLEDRFARLRPRPHPVGLALGLVLLLAAQWRQERVIQPQSVMLVLPLVQGVGLLLLLSPARAWRLRLQPLLAPLAVLVLLPLQDVVQPLMPVEALSRLTARLCQLLFLSFGVDAAVAGNELLLAGGGVAVAGPCSGAPMLSQLLVVGGIFALVFPLVRGRWWLPSALGVMVVAPLFALVANTLRIALLALLVSSNWSPRQWWFDFFHDGQGGMVFSLLAVMLFAPAYFGFQDWLLARQGR